METWGWFALLCGVAIALAGITIFFGMGLDRSE